MSAVVSHSFGVGAVAKSNGKGVMKVAHSSGALRFMSQAGGHRSLFEFGRVMGVIKFPSVIVTPVSSRSFFPPLRLQQRAGLVLGTRRRRGFSTGAQVVGDGGGGNISPFPPTPKLRLDVGDESLSLTRNIGVSAHVDAGKTTLTERILYYAGRIKRMHEVRGSDGVGAVMDSMDLERERGITIQSAATYFNWNCGGNNFRFNLIDTPGHIDFTMEVERALRVLDGAVMVVCAVSGVQSQTTTVDRQMRRYNVPRIIFINKLDRDGSDAYRAIESIEQKIPISAAAVQIAIGTDSKFSGVVDVVERKALQFSGPRGDSVTTVAVPNDLIQPMEEARRHLAETVADLDDDFAESYLEDHDNFSSESLHAAIRRQTISTKFAPIFLGSAKSNKGVQSLLDGACRYLPHPGEKQCIALEVKEDSTDEVELSSDPSKPLVGMAFKIQDSMAGMLTYFRIYQGMLKKGGTLFDQGSRKRNVAKRLLQMHSDELHEVPSASAGDIVAVVGVDCYSGATLTNGKVNYCLDNMFVPDPVVSQSIKNNVLDDQPKFAKALKRFQREDPTFKIHVDDESKDQVMKGMGELHLAIYAERMKREYRLDVSVGPPKVNFREAIKKRGYFDYIHKRQSGGSGQYGRVNGYIEPFDTDEVSIDLEFVSNIDNAEAILAYIPSLEKGFKAATKQGLLTGHPLMNFRMVVEGGKVHEVDSSDHAFRCAAIGAFKTAYTQCEPHILQPVMKVEIVAPSSDETYVLQSILLRKAEISEAKKEGQVVVIHANVPLQHMFGYISDLRAATKGQGEFTMEFSHYNEMDEEEQARMKILFEKEAQKLSQLP